MNNNKKNKKTNQTNPTKTKIPRNKQMPPETKVPTRYIYTPTNLQKKKKDKK